MRTKVRIVGVSNGWDNHNSISLVILDPDPKLKGIFKLGDEIEVDFAPFVDHSNDPGSNPVPVKPAKKAKKKKVTKRKVISPA